MTEVLFGLQATEVCTYENGTITYCPDVGYMTGYCCETLYQEDRCCLYTAFWYLWYFWTPLVLFILFLSLCACGCKMCKPKPSTNASHTSLTQANRMENQANVITTTPTFTYQTNTNDVHMGPPVDKLPTYAEISEAQSATLESYQTKPEATVQARHSSSSSSSDEENRWK